MNAPVKTKWLKLGRKQDYEVHLRVNKVGNHLNQFYLVFSEYSFPKSNIKMNEKQLMIHGLYLLISGKIQDKDMFWVKKNLNIFLLFPLGCFVDKLKYLHNLDV